MMVKKFCKSMKLLRLDLINLVFGSVVQFIMARLQISF